LKRSEYITEILASVSPGLRRGDAASDFGRGARPFSEQGYSSTKIDDIATRGRVCCATIYAVSGGKQGLLNTLMDI
jgi:hypothetical protein